MKERTKFKERLSSLRKERILVPLLLSLLALLAITCISCMPEIPREDDIIVTPPSPDPLPGDKEEEPEQPKSWVWHQTGTCPEALSFKIPEDESGVQILISGHESKIVGDGDEYVILSLRVRMMVKKLDGEWKVYLDGAECGVFRYE